ncbi:MAG TPA: hypothetical protein VFX49_19400, partial [Chloroflexota bacterium]|nr:hypothetical protein [Chloroflexota bacterium]
MYADMLNERDILSHTLRTAPTASATSGGVSPSLQPVPPGSPVARAVPFAPRLGMRLRRDPDRPRFYLTLREASARFGVDAETLAAAVRTGALRSKRVNRQSWVAPSAV